MKRQAISVAKNRGRGRPRKEPSAIVRVSEPVLEAADAWGEQQEPPLNRANSVKAILVDYLKRRGFLT